MDDQVIEAAAKAILTEFGEVPYYRDMAEAAITAALRELAPDVKKAVDKFMLWSIRYGNCGDGRWNDEKNVARRELLALLGMPEDRA